MEYLYLYISYDANGGTGAPSLSGTSAPAGVAADYPKTVSLTVKSQVPTRSGYVFNGWVMSEGGVTRKVYGGQTVSHTFQTYTGSSQSYTINLEASWVQQTYTVNYNPGTYGTGSAVSDTKYGGTDLTLRGRIYTRTGYNMIGWSLNANGSGFAYGLNATYSIDASVTLYPCWSIIKSTITSVTPSVPADGATEATVQINRPNSDFTHKVVVQLGSRSQEITNVGLSCTFTIPAAWIDQIPEATSGTGKVLLYTYRGSSQIGSPDTKNFTVTVPDSVVPTVSLAFENLSDNATVDGWDTLVQGFSKIKLTATAAAGSGSSISTVAFSGDGVSQVGSALTVTSDLLINAGDRTWTVIVTDKRGRTATTTITRTVYEYRTASIEQFAPFRSSVNGVEDPGTGTYITATPVYSIASCNGHNTVSVKKIEYKINTGSTWTTGQASASSGTTYTFGTISVLYAYDVRITVTDALGSTIVYSVQIPSAIGFSFGLNGRCARFGGPVQYDDRLEFDFKAQFDDDVEVQGDLNVNGDASLGDVAADTLATTGNASVGGTLSIAGRQLMKSLWTGTWNSGSISVPGVNDYTVFMIVASAPTAAAEKISLLALRSGDSGELIRGAGGHSYSTGTNGRWQYWFAAEISTDSLTFDSLLAIVNGNPYYPSVIEIIGVI